MLKRSVSIYDIKVSELEPPLYKSLARTVGEMIEDRRIEGGAFLPSRKDLAARLGVSVQTVREAYEDLEQRGYVSGEVGRGTRVLDRPEGVEWNTILDERDDSLVDLSILRPVFGPPHANAVEETLGEIARRRDFQMFSAYRPSAGMPAHRAAMAVWLRSLGVERPAEDLLITNGATHAAFLALASVTEPDDAVLAPALTDVGMIGICRTLKLHVFAVEEDDEGVDPDAFERACAAHAPKAVVLTPTLANPRPTVMSEDRRRRIARIAEAHDVMIIEDDCFSALLAAPPPPIKAIAPERVIYLTTFSKALMSGLRIGCVAPPAALRDRIAARLRGTTWMAAPMMVELAARWIETGVAAELARWQSAELATRQAIVRESLPRRALVSPDTGLGAWLTLPPVWRPANFIAAAAQRNIALTSPEAFQIGDGAAPAAVRLCVGAARRREDLAEAVAELDRLMSNPADLVMDFA